MEQFDYYGGKTYPVLDLKSKCLSDQNQIDHARWSKTYSLVSWVTYTFSETATFKAQAANPRLLSWFFIVSHLSTELRLDMHAALINKTVLADRAGQR